MKTLCQHRKGFCTQCNQPMDKDLRRTCTPGKIYSHTTLLPRKGPGSRLASLLSKFGMKKKTGCGCERRERTLNLWWIALKLFFQRLLGLKTRQARTLKDKARIETLSTITDVNKQILKEEARRKMLETQALDKARNTK